MSATIDFLLGPAWPWVRILLFLVGTAAFAGLNAAYLVWCERKMAAYVQRRPGPMEVGPQGLLQPIADAISWKSHLVSLEGFRRFRHQQ